VLQLPIVILFEKYSADQPSNAGFVRENTNNVGAAFYFFVQALDWIGRVQLATVGLRIVHVGEHVMFGLVEQGGHLSKARAELIGNVAPSLSGSLAIGLNEDLPNCGRDDTLLAFRHMDQ